MNLLLVAYLRKHLGINLNTEQLARLDARIKKLEADAEKLVKDLEASAGKPVAKKPAPAKKPAVEKPSV